MDEAVEEATAKRFDDPSSTETYGTAIISTREALGVCEDYMILRVFCATVGAGTDGRLYFHIDTFEW